MKLLLALNHEGMEGYIAELPGEEVISILRSRKKLLEIARSSSADLLLLSADLPGDEDMRELIVKLTSKGFPHLRIGYFYGEDGTGRKEFIDFLISRGIYDYHIGLDLTEDDIRNMLYSPKSRNDVASDIMVKSEPSPIYEEAKPVKTVKKERSRPLSKFGELIGPRNETPPVVIVKELDTAVITLISNHTTGKTHTAWNLSYCLAERGYQTSILNLDRGYSANLYYGIEDIYYGILDKIIETEEYKSILEYCYKRKNLNVITGRLGSMEDISIEAFSKLLFYIRSKSDMTIIDTKTGMSELTAAAVENATIVLLVFDSDLMHFHLNKMMIESLGDLFIPERTIALINDCDTESESFKFIHEQIKSLGLPFKAVLPVSSCMSLGCDMMHTDKTAYQAAEEKHGQFKEDMDSLLKALNAKQKRNLLQKLFSFGK